MRLNSHCPLCGSQAYTGLKEVECSNLACENWPKPPAENLWLYGYEGVLYAD